jgi:hypothetical protein
MSIQDAVEVPFRTLAHRNAAKDVGGGLSLLRSQGDWAGQWRVLNAFHGSEPPLPVVDWATDMVVLLVCGARPGSGYGVTVESIAIDGTSIEVRAVERRPGPDAVTLAVMTNPFHAVVIAAYDGAERLVLRIEYDHVEP